MKKRVGAPRWCMQQDTAESDEARSNAKRSKKMWRNTQAPFSRESTVAFMGEFLQSFTAGRRFPRLFLLILGLH